MVADLNFPVTIVPVPTVREPDGLAMSSRNQRLTPEQRRIAPRSLSGLVRSRAFDPKRCALGGGGEAWGPGDPGAEIPKSASSISKSSIPTFQSLETVTGEVRIAAAVWLGQVRLIDNLKV